MKSKTKYQMSSAKRRDGISIIEVLTSLAVATIGVFGVLVLIPFAVKQAQIGLDQDAADTIGRNALADLQIYGFTTVNDRGQMSMRGSKVLLTGVNVNNPEIFSDDTLGVVPIAPAEIFGIGSTPVNLPPNFFPIAADDGTNSYALNTAHPRIIHFDPVAVSNVKFLNENAGTGFPAPPTAVIPRRANPDFLTGDLPTIADTPGPLDLFNDLRITVANGVCPGGDGTFDPGVGESFRRMLDREEVNRIFRTGDDLILGDNNFLLPQTADPESTSETDLPQPVFDVSTNGNLMKRQTNGRISWSALFVPVKDGSRVKDAPIPPDPGPPTVVENYKVYVLVYKDRSVDPSDPESVMAAAQVNRYASGLAVNPPIGANGGFNPTVDQIHLNSPSDGVFKDDWVMLINRRPAPEYGEASIANLGLSFANANVGRLKAEEAGYDVQVAFEKVVSVLSDDVSGTSTLNVAGEPFDFYYTDIAGRDYGVDATGAPDMNFSTETYAIHLKNVINVYERTIALRRDSAAN